MTTIGRDKGDETGELTELGKWSRRAQRAKGGFVGHKVSYDGIKKACGCMMGDKNCTHKREL